MPVSAPRIARPQPLLAAGALVAAVLALLLGPAAARADLLYWDNAGSGTIGVVDTDGSGASLLNTSGAEIDSPGGISYDPVANRLYVASEESVTGLGWIVYVNLDGSGAGVFSVPAQAIWWSPHGVVIDPVARIAYWINFSTRYGEWISWARLDGSEGGILPLGTVALDGAVRLSVDPAAGRLYWANSDGSIRFAPLVGSGGTEGVLAAKGAGTITGLSVDPVSNRIFWLEQGVGKVFVANLNAAPHEEVGIGAAPIDDPWGLAYDPDAARLYWGNFGNETSSGGAIGFSGLGSGAGAITPGIAVDGPQDPLVIKSPSNTEAPKVALVGGRLECSQGSWAGDHVSSFVYRSPRSFSFRWTLNGEAIAGAAEPSYAPPKSGTYACVVTATNQAGSSSQTSNGLAVKVTVPTRPKVVMPTKKPAAKAPQVKRTPADLVLAGGKARHLRAKPGRLLVLRVRAVNRGVAASNPARVCLKVAKRAKRALRPGKCRQLGPVGGGDVATARVRLRVKKQAAPGLYRLRIALPGDRTKVTVRIPG